MSSRVPHIRLSRREGCSRAHDPSGVAPHQDLLWGCRRNQVGGTSLPPLAFPFTLMVSALAISSTLVVTILPFIVALVVWLIMIWLTGLEPRSDA